MRRLGWVGCAMVMAACGKSSTTADPAPSAGGPSATGGSASGGKGGAGGATGSRGIARAVLSAADVQPIRRGLIEATTAISGDLRPVETINVRARLDGDVAAVLVRDGDRVSEGQLLARLDAAEQDAARGSAEADRASANSDLATAQWTLDQTKELFKAGAVAEGELRTRQQAVESAKARLAASDARLRTAERDVGGTRVTAPASGTVEKRFIQPGERVLRGAALFTVVRSNVLELAAAVPARASTGIRPGQMARFTADGRSFTGTVARVSATIDPQTRAITVYLQIPNGDGSLKGNAFAAGKIIGRSVAKALLVPTSALRQGVDDGAPYVYRVDGDQIGTAKLSLGIIDDAQGMAEVLDGLKENDRVVVGNVGTLGRGMKVTIVGAEKPKAEK